MDTFVFARADSIANFRCIQFSVGKLLMQQFPLTSTHFLSASHQSRHIITAPYINNSTINCCSFEDDRTSYTTVISKCQILGPNFRRVPDYFVTCQLLCKLVIKGNMPLSVKKIVINANCHDRSWLAVHGNQ